jgi:uncharacterized protein (TIGR00255 family)
MMNSMTGFGQAAGEVEGRTVSVELKSVNNRYKDVVVRSPRAYAALEDEIKKTVGAKIVRGRVDVYIQVDDRAAKRGNLKLDLDLARTYHQLIDQLKDELNLVGQPSLSDFLSLKDVITYEEESPDLDAFLEGLRPVVIEALDKLIAMRQTEGRALAADFRGRLAEMAERLDRIERRRDTVVVEAKNKLEARLKSLSEDLDLDQQRLHQEAAYIIDRSDITEEIVRLRSHFDQFGRLLESDGGVGRRLDFLIQEMNREINTIGSKSSDVDVTNAVVDLKTELEKLREQAQNVE